MIASVAFRNFKALRATGVALGPFNLVIGPNGSGKTSLIEALLCLRTLAEVSSRPAGAAAAHPVGKSRPVSAEPPGATTAAGARRAHGPAAPEIECRFAPPYAELVARVRCETEDPCDAITIQPPDAPGWPALRAELTRIRGYVLDHTAMSAPAPRRTGDELMPDGANVAAVLDRLQRRQPAASSALAAELFRIMPEFHALELLEQADDRVEFGLRLADNGLVTAAGMSQGMLYLVTLFTLAFAPSPPRVVCIEDVDRGIHPRMLREVRDALYRLSYPKSFGLEREPVQVVVTTHSPYFIDLFREHPEEVVISQKRGRVARFERLSERPDLPELLREGSLGDMWFSGILGGVPDEP